ncbi:YtxH domain-containing protein [Dyadobacter jiangsuensis]|uniref:YtxH domain-containing protein n=1 Tax=Dyadobacter jiangsuensis TaxID=1591085 RepID=UPI000D0D6D57|nr:YtxH domain-containing protein [Dyadobacter jiangsuensis]
MKPILPLLLAAGAGLAAGLLIAPEKGSRLRRKFRFAIKDAIEDLGEPLWDTARNIGRKGKTGCSHIIK